MRIESLHISPHIYGGAGGGIMNHLLGKFFELIDKEKREDTEITNIIFNRIYTVATDYTAAIFILIC